MLKPYNNSILEIEPYIPGASVKSKKNRSIKLSSNENPFGCSDAVKEAITKHFTYLHRYPEGTSLEVRKKIGQVYNLDYNKIICGAGSDELITLICLAYAGQGAEIIYTKHGFLMYPITALSVGAKPVIADEVNLKADIDEILKKVTGKTRILFLANPNNPTGSYLSHAEILELRKKLPQNILLVLDLAYAEFVENPDYVNAKEICDEFDNVIMIRTFSKVYGIPSVRLGWAYANDKIIDVINRVRGPFNVSSVAQIAGVAALEDQDFVKKTIKHNNIWLKKLTEEFSALGYKPYPSVANFILTDFGSKDNAEKIDNFLKEEGISVRRMDAYKLPTCIRISIGTEDENLELLKSLKSFR
ncbi:MAG: histidinol-phosphate transaminase [Rickettsiales bacterium]|nr:histidinol-phosphate transaminase [Rickettsiales bacterium]